MTLSACAVEWNGRGQSTGDGNVPYVAALLMEYFFHKSPWWIVGSSPPPLLDSDGDGLLSGMGVDSPQAMAMYRCGGAVDGFFLKNCHCILRGYTPPHSIQMAPVIGGVTHDPVNAHR